MISLVNSEEDVIETVSYDSNEQQKTICGLNDPILNKNFKVNDEN